MYTLVLDASYQPLRVVPVRKALKDLANGRVELLAGYDDILVWVSSKLFPLPSVVRFIRWAGRKFNRTIKFNRKNLWLRDKGICQYCGKKVALHEFTFDHVIPRRLFGKTCWENIVVACEGCNQKKSGCTPEQAGMKLLHFPVKPKSLPLGQFHLTLGVGIPSSWKDYLGSVEYWNGILDE